MTTANPAWFLQLSVIIAPAIRLHRTPRQRAGFVSVPVCSAKLRSASIAVAGGRLGRELKAMQVLTGGSSLGFYTMPSIPSRQSMWNPLAAYALIKVLGWLRREPDRPDVEAPLNQHWPAETVDRSSDTASRKRRAGLIMGFRLVGFVARCSAPLDRSQGSQARCRPGILLGLFDRPVDADRHCGCRPLLRP